MENKKNERRRTPMHNNHKSSGESSSRHTSKPTHAGGRLRVQGRATSTSEKGGKKTRTGFNSQKRRGPPQPRPHARKKDDAIPRLEKNTIRIIPLGGVEEIGRNMTAIEFNDDIIVVDCGFLFQQDDTPGVDYILPNTKYLEDNKHKIKGIIITHGHLDHIGGIPYIIDRIGNPPIYTRRLTGVMIKKRQEEFPHLPNIDIREVETTDSIKIGELPIRFYGVTHTIPDSMGVIIKTPYGGITITGDIKLNHDGTGVVDQEEIDSFSVFKEEKILCLLMDSTNTGRPGWSVPEYKVFKTFEKIIKNTKHRLIIGTFASQLERVIKIIEIAEKNGRKVVLEGRSMKGNLAIAEEIGLLGKSVSKSTLISSQQMADYPESKILILATGAQGDTYAALMRMADKTHRQVKLTPKDTIVLSSSVIPGNERAVQSLKDKMARQGVHIVTYETDEVHASGHGNAEEAKWIHKQVNPKYFIPQHGYFYMLRGHSDLMQESCGLKMEDIIIPDNGTIIEIRNEGKEFVRVKAKAPMTTRIVEGLHVRDIQEAVIKDRLALSQDGIFVVVVTVNLRTGKLRKSPDIISRGFVYLRESQELLGQTRLIIKKTVENRFRGSRKVDIDTVKDEIVDVVAKFLLQETHKNPIVIPVIVGV
ncbi:MAG: ribonuclease J [Candidatus Pacebacteria bacterium]|nr:ribonuclease J [Candidatus Paceibacterota bacterium]